MTKNVRTVLFLFVLISFSFARSEPLDYFKATYELCEKDFDKIFATLKLKNPNAQTFQFLYPQGNIKSYFFPSEGLQTNLLVMISGTHGIEGFTGSAVQRYLLENSIDFKNTGVLMIHGFNLWGFKNLRRVNENNVDLNRNFILDRNHFKSDDSSYTQLNNFLNPQSEAHPGIWGHTVFVFKALYYIARYSVESLRASILKGQYSFEKGIFYGGKEPQEQELMLQQLILKYFAPYKKVFLIDLHTGYGENAKLHLLAGRSTDPNSQELKNVFSADEIDFSDKKKFYAVEGEMATFFAQKVKEATGAQVTSVIFEYGTMDSQKIQGSVESLRRMILENQDFHNKQNNAVNADVQNLFTEMFYPSSLEWRKSVIAQTDEKMKKIFKFLQAP